MKKSIFFMLGLIFLSTISANAQVLIGESDSDVPSKGALLDLRFTVGYGGLLLPRVALVSATTWSPLGNEEADAIDGMVVYNESDSSSKGLTGKGLYEWHDGGWKLITSGEEVDVQIESISLNVTDLSFDTMGQTAQLVAIFTPVNASNRSVVWSSSDPTFATVDPDTGLVTALKDGNITIIATTVNGKTAACNVAIAGIPIL